MSGKISKLNGFKAGCLEIKLNKEENVIEIYDVEDDYTVESFTFEEFRLFYEECLYLASKICF